MPTREIAGFRFETPVSRAIHAFQNMESARFFKGGQRLEETRRGLTRLEHQITMRREYSRALQGVEGCFTISRTATSYAASDADSAAAVSEPIGFEAEF